LGGIESINATSRAIMLSGLDKRIPLRGTQMNGIAWRKPQSDAGTHRTLMAEVKQVSDNVAHDCGRR